MLDTITATTFGKWWVSFEAAAQNQMKNRTNWDPTIIFSSGNMKTTMNIP